jgi:GH25 family lysozyme M1 (1,4-beta-N-acetylmuramidase)
MKNDKKDEMCVNFPIVKNVSPRLLADDIKGMTTEETREAMKKMFDDFEKQTGYNPIIVGDESPTRVLFPSENIKPTDK